MGQVWRGVHETQLVPVAVKVITAELARNPQYLKAFNDEVRAVAGLEHPSIVMVFDHGEIPKEVEEISRGALRSGSPYLVMEYASLGSLGGLQGNVEWDELEAVLIELLDALAHAHARGLTHLDLKPANILLSSTLDLRPGVKLTDFGISHVESAEEDSEVREGSAGTPLYMAPEQFNGKYRDFGPWTDLYALGCMAWELACGEPPFDGASFVELAYKHLRVAPPVFDPIIDVPDGFEAWVCKAIQKEPGHRFLRAADAAHALAKLRPDDDPWWTSCQPKVDSLLERLESGARDSGVLPGMMSTGALSEHMEWAATIMAEPVGLAQTAEHASLVAVPGTTLAPPTPPRPESARGLHSSPQLVGAGLGLYGVRTVPLVDRTEERAELWKLIKEARKSNAPRVALLSGAAGYGKSCLAEWVCRRAHEVGAASVLRATHTQDGSVADGIGRMVARQLRSIGLDYAETLSRAEVLMRALGAQDADEFEWRHLAQTACPDHPAEVGEADAAERHLAVHRLLSRMSRERPVLVWLDDVQWGGDSLLFVDRLLERTSERFPVLVIATYQPLLLGRRPVETVLVERLARHEATARFEVGPLESADRHELVSNLLGLEGDLAIEVERRSGGNPLFAIQLVGDWVERGVLVMGQHGFALRDGERATLPDSIHEIAAERVNHLLAAYPEEARVALELAAILGKSVDADEWNAVCGSVGASVPTVLMDELLDHRMMVSDEKGWTFVHGVVRESLERSAVEAGRLAIHHQACATVLFLMHPHRTASVAQRIAHHAAEAGDHNRAVELLLEAAREVTSDGRYERAGELLRERGRLLSTLGAAPDDARLGAGMAARIEVLIARGALDEAKAVGEDLARRAAQAQWIAYIPQAHDALGDIARIRGDADAAIHHYREALTGYAEQGRRSEEAHILFDLADLAGQRGDLANARSLYEQGSAICADIADRLGSGTCALGLARVAAQGGRLDEAQVLLTQARTVYDAHGRQAQLMECTHLQGDLSRLRGDRESAEQCYGRALAFYVAVGSGNAPHVRLSMAFMHLALAMFDEARHELDLCLDAFVASGEEDDQGRVHAAYLAAAAAASDWPAWDGHMEAATRLLEETSRVDRDVAWAARFASGLAEVSGDSTRGQAAARLADAQAAALIRS
jgi:eukaryotic-like serine/threonine-protein kinase